jgi:S-formylglutathione hydrolase FrmB
VRRAPARTRHFGFVAVAVVLVLAIAGFVAYRIVFPGVHPDRYGMRLVRFRIHSRLVGEDLTQLGVLPPALPDGRRRPLLVWLHGRGSSPDDAVSDAMLDALQNAGDRAPAVVLANGDDASYYHDRSTGRWGSYLVREVIPRAVRVLHADPRRIAIGGVSMGGFGALDVARLHPHAFCAVGGHSAALWETGGQTPQGAFDDAEDFARHDLFTEAEHGKPLYPNIPVWMDVGDADPFHDSDSAFEALLRRTGNDVTFHVWPGAHNGSYWQSHMDDYIPFYTRALAAC